MNIHDDVSPVRFHVSLRVLHWLMATLVIVMLLMGVAMVSTSGPAYTELLVLHRPLGLALLALAIVRIAIRIVVKAPRLPLELPTWQARAARSSHMLLYVALIGLPLVGWAMLSAGGYPVYFSQTLVLPPIVSQDIGRFSLLRALHAWGAYGFFGLILVHTIAALTHAFVRRDRVFSAMSFGKRDQNQSQKNARKPQLTGAEFNLETAGTEDNWSQR